MFDEEPLAADHQLRDPALEDRLLLTPHLGYASEETFRLFYRQSVEAIRAYLEGAPIRRLA